MKTVRCVLYLRPIPRRWWQIGTLAPLPVCRPAAARSCRRHVERQNLEHALDTAQARDEVAEERRKNWDS